METGAVRSTVTDRPNNGDRPSARPSQPSDLAVRPSLRPLLDAGQLDWTAWSDGRFGRTDGFEGWLGRTDGLVGQLGRTD
ncbi:hypothetical protein BpHYR1_005282, partial [Brachionus plicatilis]